MIDSAPSVQVFDVMWKRACPVFVAPDPLRARRLPVGGPMNDAHM